MSPKFNPLILKEPPPEVIILVPTSGSLFDCVIDKKRSAVALHSRVLSVLDIIGLNVAGTKEVVVNVSLKDHIEASIVDVS